MALDSQRPAPAKPGPLLRWGLPRDSNAAPHLLAMTVSAVATVLLTRGILAALGFPQLGGNGLHIAHVLWGGLLMLASMMILLSYAGPAARPFAAVLGGVGFGLFIDEVGKFVTSDNDYFYRPAAAIMYVVVVAIVLGVHALHGRRAHYPAEHLASAVDYAVLGVAGGFNRDLRTKALVQLRRAGPNVAGAAEVSALIHVIPDDPYELPDPIGRTTRMIRKVSRRVLGVRAIRVVAIVAVSLQALSALLSGLVAILAAALGTFTLENESPVVVFGSLVSGLLAAALTIVGLTRLRHDQASAFRWFQRGVLVNLFLTQVFQFANRPLAACFSVALDLLLLAVIDAELDWLRTRHPVPPPVVDGPSTPVSVPAADGVVAIDPTATPPVVPMEGVGMDRPATADGRSPGGVPEGR